MGGYLGFGPLVWLKGVNETLNTMIFFLFHAQENIFTHASFGQINLANSR